MMGGRTLAPNPICKLQEENPKIYKELVNYAEDLELHFKDMQDTQFTIMDGKLFLLYSKHAKRTPTSALKVCLLYTSDAADDTPCVDLGGRRIIKKKTKLPNRSHHTHFF
eukprot:TRINITY_DN21398_c0_g1_i2.p2 TRINITY_DN21398_c0_g1~~TRINITY_DN21398_c0_g1_i2.p2  ORF type:complete len:110 (+),score=19.48 TRINITY_DN21398_c0_g1_i2:160-489(+)